VALVNSYLRINGLMNVTAGTGTINAGDIIVRPSGGGVTYSQIPIGFGRSQTGIYTIPSNRIGFLIDTAFNLTSGTANDQVSFQLLSRAYNGAFFSRALVSATATTPTIMTDFRLTGMFNPGDDLIIRNISQVATNVQCHAVASLLLVQAPVPLIL
jgi:hypothetical protein